MRDYRSLINSWVYYDIIGLVCAGARPNDVRALRQL